MSRNNYPFSSSQVQQKLGQFSFEKPNESLKEDKRLACQKDETRPHNKQNTGSTETAADLVRQHTMPSGPV
jgi:hypothetical protein